MGFLFSVIDSSFKFYYLKEISFDYRVTSGSMIRGFNSDMLNKNIEFIRKKHYNLYLSSYLELTKRRSVSQNDLFDAYSSKQLLAIVFKRIKKKLL